MIATHRKLHRILGLLLAAPLILWMVTGVLFHVKYRYSEAFDSLAFPLRAEEIPWKDATLSPAELISQNKLDANAKISLRAHPTGRPIYIGAKSGKAVLIDAQSGAILNVATEEEAKRWVEAAVAASSYSSRYGTPSIAQETTQYSGVTGSENPAFVFEFSGDKKVTVDRLTGEMTQTGALNDWIDFTYRIHYLQWTPWKPVNIALVLLATPIALALAFSGIRMFFKK